MIDHTKFPSIPLRMATQLPKYVSGFCRKRIGLIPVYSQVARLLNSLQNQIPSIKFKQISSKDDKELKKSEILIADVKFLLPILYDVSHVKWIQITRAGVDELVAHVKGHERPRCIITRYTGPAYASLMAEYVLHQIIDYERDFDRMRNNQKTKIWSRAGKIRAYRTIGDLSIGILGVGTCGSVVAKFLYSFGATIYALRRTKKESSTMYRTVFFGKDELPELLRLCDYLVSVLPETEDTKGLLNNGVLENCKGKETVFINVGRGSIIREDDLIQALEKGWLKTAILDVFNTEPLPKENPLWITPGVIITPHVATYNRAEDIASVFKSNLKLYQENKPIPGLIDFDQGY